MEKYKYTIKSLNVSLQSQKELKNYKLVDII